MLTRLELETGPVVGATIPGIPAVIVEGLNIFLGHIKFEIR